MLPTRLIQFLGSVEFHGAEKLQWLLLKTSETMEHISELIFENRDKISLDTTPNNLAKWFCLLFF